MGYAARCGAAEGGGDGVGATACTVNVTVPTAWAQPRGERALAFEAPPGGLYLRLRLAATARTVVRAECDEATVEMAHGRCNATRDCVWFSATGLVGAAGKGGRLTVGVWF